MSKITTIEWLIQEINKINVSNEARIFINKLEKQAKAMEKQQMKDAVLEQSTKHERLRKIFEKQFEEYYNETYGK